MFPNLRYHNSLYTYEIILLLLITIDYICMKLIRLEQDYLLDNIDLNQFIFVDVIQNIRIAIL